MSKKNAILVYSRKNPEANFMYDKRVPYFNELGQKNVYVNGFGSITRELFRNELEEAKKRVNIKGGYNYTPSNAWRNRANKLINHKTV